jgi:hypothetical protein
MPDHMTSAEPLVERLYSLDELNELRRNTLRYARSFPAGDGRDQHRRLHVPCSQTCVSREAGYVFYLHFKRRRWVRSIHG